MWLYCYLCGKIKQRQKRCVLEVGCVCVCVYVGVGLIHCPTVLFNFCDPFILVPFLEFSLSCFPSSKWRLQFLWSLQKFPDGVLLSIQLHFIPFNVACYYIQTLSALFRVLVLLPILTWRTLWIETDVDVNLNVSVSAFCITDSSVCCILPYFIPTWEKYVDKWKM